MVVAQVRRVGKDPALLHQVLAEARRREEERTAELEVEQRGLEKDLAAWSREVQKLSAPLRPGDENGPVIARLADVQERITLVQGRVQKVREQVRDAGKRLIDEEEAALALSVFDPVWGSLAPKEQARAIDLLVERVDYDGGKGKVAICFRATGIKTLADELANQSSKGRTA